ncbi:hypothetical protein [Cellulomonas sp. Marseille-Q8402]
MRGLGGLIEAVASGSSALARYANLVEEIAEEAVLVRRQRQDAAEGLARALLLSAPPTLPKGTVFTHRELQRQARQRQQAQESARLEVGAADRAMAELVDRRVAADGVVCEALGSVEIGDWAAIGKASIAAGMTSPDMVGGAATQQVLESLARDVLDGNASMDDLMRLLDAWGGDEEVLSGFFRSLGGSGTVALVDMLSEQVYAGEVSEDVARRHAEGLLSAMSLASASWTPGQARRFTEQMTDHERWPGAVGFLFSSADTAPMGENFTVAMADHIDTHVRLNGVLPLWYPSDGHVLANLLYPDRSGRGTEPMSGVLETLGKYPEAALDWLMEGADDNTAPRIEYWVGQHDWHADGYLGVSALWSGLQRQPGGPLDVARYDEQTWERLARANTAFGRGLFANPGALPENWSVEAQVHLATALGQMMTLLAHDVSKNPSGGGKLSESYEIFVWADDGTAREEMRPIPLLNRKQIAMLFGLAASSVEGSWVLGVGVRRAQEALLHAALTTPGFDPDSGLGVVADMQALLDGALVGSVEGITDRAAERVSDLVGDACTLIDLVPVPGSGKAADWLAEQGGKALGETFARWAADTAVDQTTSTARSNSAEAIERWLAEGATARALHETWQGGGEGSHVPGTRESLEKFLADWIVVFRDAEGGPVTELTRHVDESPESLTADYAALWELARTQAAGK